MTDERPAASGGKLPTLTFLGHSTVLIELSGRRILTDPVLRPRLTFLARLADPPAPADYADIDLVLLSHLHHDHCDLPSLRILGANIPLVAPRGAGQWLRGKGFCAVTELGPGGVLDDSGVLVRAVTAVHSGRREPWGPVADAVGYVIESGSTCVYFAGDTDLFPAMVDLADHVDVALLPVWGWGPNLGPGHLDPVRAAEAAKLIQPHYAVPVHWGTLYPYGLRHALPNRLSYPPRSFKEAVTALDIPVHVLLTRPATAVEFTP